MIKLWLEPVLTIGQCRKTINLSWELHSMSASVVSFIMGSSLVWWQVIILNTICRVLLSSLTLVLMTVFVIRLKDLISLVLVIVCRVFIIRLILITVFVVRLRDLYTSVLIPVCSAGLSDLRVLVLITLCSMALPDLSALALITVYIEDYTHDLCVLFLSPSLPF